MYNDLNDTGVIPEKDDYDIVSFSTKKMSWELKSSNYSGNLSASVAFRLNSYDGVELDSSSNIEITVIYLISVAIAVFHDKFTCKIVNSLWNPRSKPYTASLSLHGKFNSG